mmetsp:Transcript_86447/g.201114  ORF Transcript_86447/g.201114 Transcript_86447/m.201114 type:complete len:330 (-) Transcript_86447:480-1469(-)
MCLKTQDRVRLVEEFVDVPARSSRLEVLAACQGVLLRAKACVRRRVQLGVYKIWLPDLLMVLFKLHVLAVEVARELIAIIDVDFPVAHVEGPSDHEVLGLVEHRFRFAHARCRTDVRVLAQRRPLPEDWEVLAAGVLREVFVQLNGVICKVVVHDVVHAGPVGRGVIPKALEGQNLAVVLKALVQLQVLAVPAEEELLELLAFGNVAAPSGSQSCRLVAPEGIHGHLFAALLNSAHGLLIEGARERVTVDNPKDVRVEVDVHPAPEVLVGVEASTEVLRLWDAVALDEVALQHARILLLGLCDHDCPIFQVVVDHALPHPKVLFRVLGD